MTPDEREDRGFAPQPDHLHDLRFDVSAQPKETFGDSLITKMVVGACVTTFAIAFVWFRNMAKGNGRLAQINPLVAITTVGCAMTAGAILGALLHLKDRVSAQIEKGQPVSTPLRLLFGYGLRSVLFVWLPLVFFVFLILLPVILVVAPF